MLSITEVYAGEGILYLTAEDPDSSRICHRAIAVDAVLAAKDPAAVLANALNDALAGPQGQ